MRMRIAIALFLLFAIGGIFSLQDHCDKWWIDPSLHIENLGIPEWEVSASVEVAVQYHPMYLPTTVIRDTACTPRAYFVSPHVTVIDAELSAYTSSGDETDADPWTASNGYRVFPGGIATNQLPCGTKVLIPSLYGSEVKIVNDRMNERYQPHLQAHGLVNIDVWVGGAEKKGAARAIGRRKVKVYIVEYAGA